MATGLEAREDYTSHEFDPFTGLVYAGARYYIPVLGRWNARDPLAGDYPGWSPYNYVLNTPMRLVDPTGLCPEGVETGDTFVDRNGKEAICLDADGVIATARRPSSLQSTFSQGGTLYFVNRGDRSALRETFQENPALAQRVYESRHYSQLARQAAFEATMHSRLSEAHEYMMMMAANSAMYVSALSGAGAVVASTRMLMVRSSMTVAQRRAGIAVGDRLAQASLRASTAEVGVRYVNLVATGQTDGLVSATVGISIGYALQVPFVSGIRAAPASRGASFRNAYTGQYISNDYGFRRYAINQGIGILPAAAVMGYDLSR